MVSFNDLSGFRYVICEMRIDSRCVSTQCLFYNIYTSNYEYDVCSTVSRCQNVTSTLAP